MDRQRRDLKVPLALILVYLIWGSTYLAIRYAVQSIPPFTMAGLRFVTAGLILHGVLRLRGETSPSWRECKSAVVVGFFLLFGGNGGVCWAEQRVPSGVTALLIGLVPLWMVLLDWMRPGGKRPSRKVVAGVLLGIAGLCVLVGPGTLSASRPDLVGSLVVAGCALSWAIGSLYARGAILPSSILMATSLEMIGGGVLLLMTGAVLGDWHRWNILATPVVGWISISYLILIGALVGFTCYVYALHHTTPAKASTYAFVNPVIAVFLGWAIAGEPMTLRTVGATLLIIPAVILIIFFRPKQALNSATLSEV